MHLRTMGIRMSIITTGTMVVTGEEIWGVVTWVVVTWVVVIFSRPFLLSDLFSSSSTPKLSNVLISQSTRF